MIILAFVAGLLIVIPIVITFQALWWLFAFVDELARPLAERIAGQSIPDDDSYRRYGGYHKDRATWRRANVDAFIATLSNFVLIMLSP